MSDLDASVKLFTGPVKITVKKNEYEKKNLDKKLTFVTRSSIRRVETTMLNVPSQKKKPYMPEMLPPHAA